MCWFLSVAQELSRFNAAELEFLPAPPPAVISTDLRGASPSHNR